LRWIGTIPYHLGYKTPMREPRAEEPTQQPWGVPHYYANETRVQTTPWDVTLAFYSLRPVGRGTESQPVAQCQVAISPILAKVLHQLLGDQLAGYEKNIGKLPVPPRAATPPGEDR
jgi:hypothetical protein